MELNDNIFVLPEENRDDILLRLPVKSIGRCRCVSKSWQSLLSHPDFIKRHIHSVWKFQGLSSILLRSYLCPGLYHVNFGDAHHLFDNMTVRPNKLNFGNYPDDDWTRVLASCDGLVLIEYWNRDQWVINPVTRHIRRLPYTLRTLDTHRTCGLGYDSIRDDYLVVIFSYELSHKEHAPRPSMLAGVYSLKNDAIVEFESYPFDHIVDDDIGVFFNGCIHWLGFNTDSSVIVGFDLAQRVFFERPPPCLFNNDKIVFDHLGILGGNLCILASSCDDYKIKYIWVMKEYGVEASWTKLTIDDEYATCKAVCLLGQERRYETVYYMKKGTIRDMVIFEPCGCVPFIESLASPHCSNETRLEC